MDNMPFMVRGWTFHVEDHRNPFAQIYGHKDGVPQKTYQLSIAFLCDSTVNAARLATLTCMLQFFFEISECETQALIEWIKTQLSV